MKSRDAEYFEINIECMLYIMHAVDYIHIKSYISTLKNFIQINHD